MQEYITTGISIVAAASSIAAAFLTWRKFHYHRKEWLVEIKKAYSTEIMKARLETYPELLSHLSHLSSVTYDHSKSNRSKLVDNLNKWLYAKGGLVAERQLRNCIVHLRDALRKDDVTKEEIFHWKHMTTFFLRYDVDVFGLEDSISSKQLELLSETKQRVDNLMSSSAGRDILVVGRYGDPGWTPSKVDIEREGKLGVRKDATLLVQK